MASRGLVIGKFYPPHRGHKFLIETAQAQVNHLVVIVCDKAGQTIPGPLRAAWLREIHPDVEVRVVEDVLPDDDSQAWAAYTQAILGYAPDMVFTSESYGDAYCRFLGCRHVLVDQARSHVPISATVIRADPWVSGDYLEPCVRAYFVKRVAVFGAESSGTTTMAQALAARYQTLWVPEYGREYAEAKMRENENASWRSEEFLHIAQRQCELEDAAARRANRLLICDTPAFATSIWHERYLGWLSREVAEISAERRYHGCLLTDIDIPFVQDGSRDGEAIRPWMHRRFQEWLADRGQKFALLSGPIETRLTTAAQAIDPLLV
jgi:HTH-type transcriptional repressor of NAD biosynthesis genes